MNYVCRHLLQSSQKSRPLSGRIVNATLMLHGTSAIPEYRKNGARIYDDAFNLLSSRSVMYYNRHTVTPTWSFGHMLLDRFRKVIDRNPPFFLIHSTRQQ